VKPVSGKHLCKILEAHGWELQRIKGSHHIFARDGNPNIVTVPVHGNRDLKQGTVRSILRAADLTEDDL
jgi:predicted RNA binding protein YcfA (HicA-like mRNA interferase family)